MNNMQSTETKLKMASTLKELIKEKPFSKITVNDVVATCGINRNSFYYHFGNMYDLLYWTYEQELQNIVHSFQNANANITQAFNFILAYIDENILLCKTAYESLGENELKNMFERDLRTMLQITISYIAEQSNLSVSDDFKDFLTFNFTGMIGSQIVWYIRYNEQLDKTKFLDYIQTALFSSLSATILAAADKKL